MIVVTGAAGFIGSCIVSKLNEIGRDDLIIVDHLDDGLLPSESNDVKSKNLTGKKFVKYFDKIEFINLVTRGKIGYDIEAVIHMGACSSTTGKDVKYYRENNFEYTEKLAKWALKNKMRFIYASSAATYGDGSIGYKDDVETIRKCKPLNLYGESKQQFDEWVLDNGVISEVVGLKFFNVFGPNEYHKGDMRSVVSKAYKTVAEEGKIDLFKSYHDIYKDGEQKRDFIYIKDAVSVVMFFLQNKDIGGIFNVGTGKARTWNALAKALFIAVDKSVNIKYVEMPESLRQKYQYFTQADMENLRSVGYSDPFTSLEDAIKDYVEFLKDNLYL
ncbi:MAG: ADP-glyceromanno-heptose 6-epimerase [Candidatus Omnitrophica bacterium]|nr:ADP-glyceromanno-heptose 6-epimerase [Candidatus Omnitrophota bacterium]MBU1995520.1 ADP-glyceromanno-heptose 6-epimerase [Candidatus Omnitrophota bacterium]MBU4333767.1 ADP-glyceromanno-heptose 6-epimerase [Candidatus Omnitrophota bacterium]